MTASVRLRKKKEPIKTRETKKKNTNEVEAF